MNKLIKISIWAMIPILMVGCKKDYLETNPSNDVINTLIFTNTTNAKTALEGMYRITFSHAPAVGYGGGSLHADFGQKAYDLVNDLMGNDMVVHSQGYGWFNRDYQYTELLRIQDNSRPHVLWGYYYTLINNANNIIVNIDKADGPAADKESIKGQALAMRAFCYYNLINYFQQTYKGNESNKGVPLYLTPATVGVGRGTVQQVYDAIVADLTAAELLLTGKAAEDKSHIGLRTAQGMRARVALTMEDWVNASKYAALARTGYTPMPTTEYTKGFNSVSNPEWMWGATVIVDQATIFASFFSHIDAQSNGGVSYAGLGGQKKITKDLYDQINAADIRKSLFRTPGTGTSGVPDYCQTKFRLANPSSWAADYLFMRASEMYLIEAEALSRQGNDAGARTALETLVKARFPAYTAAALSGTALRDEILLQRRIELWGEGFSWFDLKRLKVGLNRPTGAGNHGAFNPGQTVLPAGDPLFAWKICQREFNANLAFTPNDQNP
ncbi:MAG: RagB/SusD family nutrient uptake outer membrane protein [Chitinophagaceae bacterium]|nr:RagB/SusD family nutrient uptake outer membrane protein [Chitinophagaceae bacterium]